MNQASQISPPRSGLGHVSETQTLRKSVPGALPVLKYFTNPRKALLERTLEKVLVGPTFYRKQSEAGRTPGYFLAIPPLQRA